MGQFTSFSLSVSSVKSVVLKLVVREPAGCRSDTESKTAPRFCYETRGCKSSHLNAIQECPHKESNILRNPPENRNLQVLALHARCSKTAPQKSTPCWPW